MPARDSRGRFVKGGGGGGGGGGGSLGTAVLEIVANTDGLNAGLNATNQLIASQIAAQAANLSRYGIAALKSAVQLGAGFEAELNKTISIMGNVSDSMRANLGQTALEVSKQVQFSAGEIAEGYFFLASAGLDAQQQLAAIPAVAAFAQAGMFDLALATDLATDAQSALGLTSKDAEENLAGLVRVTDVLVKANTLANATTEQFAEALTNKAAAGLRGLNKSVEEGVAVLAAFADQGTKGRTAGERLYIILSQLPKIALANSSEFKRLGVEIFDSSGKMRNLADIIEDFEGATDGMSDAQRSATFAQLGLNEELGAGLVQLIGTSQKIRDYESALKSAGGTVEEVAQKQLATAAAQFDLLQNRIDAVTISLYGEFSDGIKGSALPAMGSLVGVLELAQQWFGSLDQTSQMAIASLVGFGAAIVPVIGYAGAAALALKAMVVILGGGVVAAAATAVAAMVAVAAVVTAAVVAYQYFERDIKAILRAVSDYFESLANDIAKIWDYLQGETARFFQWVVGGFNAFLRSTGEFGTALVDMFARAWNEVGEIFARASEFLGGFFEGAPQAIKDYFRQFKEGAGIIGEALTGVPDYLGNDKAAKNLKSLEGQFDSTFDQIGLTLEGATGDALDLADALGGSGAGGGDSVANELEQLEQQAQQMRLSLYPEEQLAEDIRRILELGEKFPEIIDNDAIREAFKDLWGKYDEGAIFENMVGVVEGFGFISEEMKDLFSDAVTEAAMEASAELERIEKEKQRKKDEKAAARQLETDTDFLTGLRFEARPAEAFAAELDNLSRAMENVGEALPQDVIDFFAGRLFEQFGEGSTEALDTLIDKFAELNPEIAAALKNVKQSAEKSKQEEYWEGVGDRVSEVQDLVGALPGEYDNFKRVASAALEAVQLATQFLAGSIDPVSLAIKAATLAFSFFGKEGEEQASVVDRAFEELGKALDDWGEQFTDMIVEFVKTGEFEFKEFVDQILSDILRIVVQLTITEPIINAIKGAFASGGAFVGGVQKFAAGGIVATPTLFGMAGGKAGVMGEAGPEGILPLRRTETGELGVIAAGGAGGSAVQTVNIIDQRGGGAPAPVVTQQTGANGEEFLTVLFRGIETLADTGRLDPMMGRNFGAARPGGRF